MMPWAWACSSAWQTWLAMRPAWSRGSRWLSAPPQQPFDVAALHVLADDVGLAVLVADVVDGDDVRMVAEAAHRLRLAADARQPVGVQPLGLDHGEGHVAVELRVVGQVDPLAAALAQEALDLVAAAGEGRREARGTVVAWVCGMLGVRSAAHRSVTELSVDRVGAAHEEHGRSAASAVPHSPQNVASSRFS